MTPSSIRREIMRWKKILGIIVGLVVAAIVAIIVILSSYNFNDLKPQIAQAVKEATGRDLTLGGDIKLKIGLKPALAVDDVRFQNVAWGSRPELAKVKRFEVQVALLPLLSGKIGIKRLILVEPDILVETDKSGKSNLAFEAAKKAEPAAPKEAPAKGPARLPALTFDQVRLEKATMTYRDGASGKKYSVALEKLTADAPSPDGPVRLTIKGLYNDKPFEVSGTLGSLLAAVDPQRAWPLKIQAKAGGATVNVDGEIKGLTQARDLSLTVTVQGQSIPELAKLADVKDVPDVGPFKATIKLSGPADRLAVPALDAEAGNEDLARLKLAGAIKDVQNQKGINLDFSLKGKDLSNLQKFWARPMPLKGPFEISGRASDPAVETYRISDIKVVLPDMDVSGSAELLLAGKRPKLTASLSSQKMDLRPFMPREEKKTGKEAKTDKPSVKRDRVFPNDPLSLEPLRQVDANVQIQAKKIITPEAALDDLIVVLALQDGALHIKPLKALIGGGNLEGTLALTPQGNQAVLALALKVDKFDVGRMAKEMQLTDILEGKLDADVDLKGSGGSVAALMGGLNGKVVLVMGKGRLDNKYIDLAGTDLAQGIFRLVNPFEKDKNYTDINCMVLRWDIKDGLAKSTAMVIDTSRMTVIGDGKVNLKSEELDVALDPSPKQGAGVPGVGKVGLSLSELAKPFKLGGTLASPSLAVDPTKAALAIGKSLGGAALLGPAGIAAALASPTTSGDQNPCLKALEAAKTGVKPSGTPEEKKGIADKAAEGTKGVVEGAGEKVKKLFGK